MTGKTIIYNIVTATVIMIIGKNMLKVKEVYHYNDIIIDFFGIELKIPYLYEWISISETGLVTLYTTDPGDGLARVGKYQEILEIDPSSIEITLPVKFKICEHFTWKQDEVSPIHKFGKEHMTEEYYSRSIEKMYQIGLRLNEILDEMKLRRDIMLAEKDL